MPVTVSEGDSLSVRLSLNDSDSDFDNVLVWPVLVLVCVHELLGVFVNVSEGVVDPEGVTETVVESEAVCTAVCEPDLETVTLKLSL